MKIWSYLLATRFALLVPSSLLMLAVSTTTVVAQPTIKVASIVELSGTGASAGGQFNHGLLLAVKEVNADGGILGRKIDVSINDTATQPGVALGLTKKAIDQGVFAIFGPVFSGSINVSMKESQKAGVPNWTGGEAANITTQGNPFIFRTSFTQATAMPKMAKYIVENAKLKSLVVIYANNDFGKGGLDMLKKALASSDTKIVEEISTDAGQLDFSAAVVRTKQANPEGVFVYVNEEESARALKELRKQGWTKPILGETTLTGQKVIELAGEAANGAIAHVGLTSDAPVTTIRAFKAKFEKEYRYIPDHNGMKGYSGIYAMKAAIEKVGKIDRAAVSAAMKGLKINVTRYPGALLYTEFDNKGDLDRMSFLVQVKNGKAEVIDLLPPLAASVVANATTPVDTKAVKKPAVKTGSRNP